jgi:hypothetical protein
VFANSGETAAAADYFLAVRTDGERNATFLHVPHDLVQAVCALHKREAFVLSQHVLRPCHSRNLDVDWRIYNYRLILTRRMEACVFGILCNKCRIFHRAIDVYPDICAVIVTNCCILHNFVHQRDGFQFQDTLYECSLESIKAVGVRGNVTGTDMGWRGQGTGISLRGGPVGEPGGGLVYRGLLCGRRLWRRAPLSIRAPMGRMEGVGVRSPRTLILSEGAV